MHDLTAVRSDLRDRFGAIPAQVDRLLRLGEMRIRAAGIEITRIECIKGRIRFYRDNVPIPGTSQPIVSTRPDHILDELLTALHRIRHIEARR